MDFINFIIEWQEGISICALAVPIHALVLLINQDSILDCKLAELRWQAHILPGSEPATGL